MPTSPSSIEELLGFHPPQRDPLPNEVVRDFIKKIKGKRFGRPDAEFVSRYGRFSYHDHPLQWLKFSDDGGKLWSFCPGPDGSDASVCGLFELVEVSQDGTHIIELISGCRTTFRLSPNALVEHECTDEPVLPSLIQCQREGCPQRHRTRHLSGWGDFDELMGERNTGDVGVTCLKRCSKCKQVHYCSRTCQEADWKMRHRRECKRYCVRRPFPEVDLSRADTLVLVDMLYFVMESSITRGEEREFTPNNALLAKSVGSRLYEIGGFNLCVKICNKIRAEEKVHGDAMTLECLWADPVVPGWYP